MTDEQSSQSPARRTPAEIVQLLDDPSPRAVTLSPKNIVFPNGPAKDFVINPFTELTCETAQLYVAAPYVAETSQLLSAAQNGVSVKLLAGLNASTTPQALAAVHGSRT